VAAEVAIRRIGETEVRSSNPDDDPFALKIRGIPRRDERDDAMGVHYVRMYQR